LVGIEETAKSGIETFDAILKMKKELEELIIKTSKRSDGILRVMDYLYQNPVILYPSKMNEISKMSVATTYKILEEMTKLGILNEMSGTKRDKIYLFSKYIALFKS
jgi:Fe2+ or Zn2+ uptake regulation protein